MSLPFSRQEKHFVFSNTFLMDVEWRMHYSMQDTEKVYAALGEFVRSSLNQELERPDFDAMGILPLRYRKSDETIDIKLTRHFAEFHFRGNAYVSFEETVMPFLRQFFHSLEKADCEIHHLSCNKKNIVALDIKDPVSERDLLEKVLSEDFLKYSSQKLRGIDFESEDTPSTYYFRASDDGLCFQGLYGVMWSNLEKEDGEAFKVYSVPVESQCESMEKNALAEKNISNAKRINDVLFDFLCWAFQPRVFAAMERDEK